MDSRFTCPTVIHRDRNVKLQIEIPDKYAEKLDEIETVEPTIHDQIEVEVLPQILRLINDAHRQLQEQDTDRLAGDSEE